MTMKKTESERKFKVKLNCFFISSKSVNEENQKINRIWMCDGGAWSVEIIKSMQLLFFLFYDERNSPLKRNLT